MQPGESHGSDFGSIIRSFLTRWRLPERAQEGLAPVFMSTAAMDLCHRKEEFSTSACQGNLVALTS